MASQSTRVRSNHVWPMVFSLGFVLLVIAGFWVPETVLPVSIFVAQSLVSIAPIVVPGIILAAWIAASGASDNIARVFEGRTVYTVLIASLIGAITPVCGVTVLPLMAGLLAGGVPLAPVMAFWLSSPITDPAMLATTAATLGLPFAVGKTIAAISLGLFGGLATVLFANSVWYGRPLRENAIVGRLGAASCGGPVSYMPAIWRSGGRRARFWRETGSLVRLILICLIPAFAAEYALNAVLQPQALMPYLGAESWWAVPLAVFVGAPAYLDGYAALPLTRGLIEHGMSQGAAMAFLVSGGVVSIWGAMAIFPVLRLKPFLVYLMLATAGSLIAGWLFELAV